MNRHVIGDHGSGQSELSKVIGQIDPIHNNVKTLMAAHPDEESKNQTPLRYFFCANSKQNSALTAVKGIERDYRRPCNVYGAKTTHSVDFNPNDHTERSEREKKLSSRRHVRFNHCVQTLTFRKNSKWVTINNESLKPSNDTAEIECKPKHKFKKRKHNRRVLKEENKPSCDDDKYIRVHSLHFPPSMQLSPLFSRCMISSEVTYDRWAAEARNTPLCDFEKIQLPSLDFPPSMPQRMISNRQ